MAKNSIRDYSATNSANTDIQSIDISEGCSPAGINNAIREVMADLKDVSTGAVALESPAADSLSVTGNVGIGTASPTSKLSLVSGTNAGITVNDGTVNTILFNTSSANGSVGTTTNHPMAFYSNNAERMRITAVGGIEIPNQNAIDELTFTGTAFTNVFSNTTGGFQLGTTGAGYLSFLTNNAERMRIDGATGSVGIGTASPAATLESKTSTSGAPATSGTTPANVALRLSSTATTGLIDIGMNGASPFIQATDSGDLSQKYNLALNPNGGSVGIGTSSPIAQSKLTVAGHSLSLTGADQNFGAGGVRGMLDLAGGYLRMGAVNGGGSASGVKLLTPAGAEALVVDSNGSLLVNSAAVNFAEKLKVHSAVSYTINSSRSGTGSEGHIAFQNANGAVGTIFTNGTSTSYNTSSDYRLKTEVTYDWDATSRLKQLKPARFKWIAEGDDAVFVDGFLAHECEAVPEAITGTKDAMRDEEYEVTPAVLDEDGNEVTPAVIGTRSVPNYQGIDQSKLVPLLVKTIQELEARITALEAN